MQQSSVGSFYVNENETVIDPMINPVHQPPLKQYDELLQRDLRYARVVAGASKMPMNMIWVARNTEELSETDLAAFKDIAWGEFVRKRYLSGLPGNTSVQSAATSMLDIVREMNLQSRRLLVMGLHEQVEASEIQLILHLCQAEIIRTEHYRVVANLYRRHDKLYEAFALAVGAFVCASAPFTLGSGTGRYERDLQYEYKKHTTALFVWALRKVHQPDAGSGMEVDYVDRVSRLLVVRPSPSDTMTVGDFKPPGGGDDCCSKYVDAIVKAQQDAETALIKVQDVSGSVRTELNTKIGSLEQRLDTTRHEITLEKAGLADRLTRVTDTILSNIRLESTAHNEKTKNELSDKIQRESDLCNNTCSTNCNATRAEIYTVNQQTNQLGISIATMTASLANHTAIIEELKFSLQTPEESRSLFNSKWRELKQEIVETSNKTKKIDDDLDRLEQSIKDLHDGENGIEATIWKSLDDKITDLLDSRRDTQVSKQIDIIIDENEDVKQLRDNIKHIENQQEQSIGELKQFTYDTAAEIGDRIRTELEPYVTVDQHTGIDPESTRATIRSMVEEEVKLHADRQIIQSITAQVFQNQISNEFKKFAAALNPRTGADFSVNVLHRLLELESKSGIPGNEVFADQDHRMGVDAEFLIPPPPP